MNPTTSTTSNIVLSMTPDEARLIVRSLEDTMKGWVEAYDRLVDDARNALLEGDEHIVHECVEGFSTLASSWKAQREMIHEIQRSLKNQHACDARKCSNGCGCDDFIPF